MGKFVSTLTKKKEAGLRTNPHSNNGKRRAHKKEENDEKCGTEEPSRSGHVECSSPNSIETNPGDSVETRTIYSNVNGSRSMCV